MLHVRPSSPGVIVPGSIAQYVANQYMETMRIAAEKEVQSSGIQTRGNLTSVFPRSLGIGILRGLGWVVDLGSWINQRVKGEVKGQGDEETVYLC